MSAIPSEYLDVSLRELLALAAHSAPRGASVPLDAVLAAVGVYVQRLERTRVASEADQREWLAQQFDQITIPPAAPNTGGRNA